MEFRELRTERLLLRAWRAEDAVDAFEYGRDPEWGRYLPEIPRPYESRHAEGFIASALAADFETRSEFAIELEGRVIGGVRLTWESGVARATHRAGAAYSLARAHWGRGLAAEAVAAVLAYGFEQRAVERVTAEIDVRNAASIRLAERLGMHREGVLRGHWWYPAERERVDALLYGLMRTEWRPPREQARFNGAPQGPCSSRVRGVGVSRGARPCAPAGRAAVRTPRRGHGTRRRTRESPPRVSVWPRGR